MASCRNQVCQPRWAKPLGVLGTALTYAAANTALHPANGLAMHAANSLAPHPCSGSGGRPSATLNPVRRNFSHVLIVFGLIALAVPYTITSFGIFTNDGFWWGMLSLIPFANVVMAFLEQIWLGVIWLACAAIFMFGIIIRPRYR